MKNQIFIGGKKKEYHRGTETQSKNRKIHSIKTMVDIVENANMNIIKIKKKVYL